MSPYLTEAGRLDFVLPEFTRLAWTSDLAHFVWNPRFQRIIRAWSEIEWAATSLGVRHCALVLIPEKDLVEREQAWRSRGLTAFKLETITKPSSGAMEQATSSTAPLRFVISAAEDKAEFLKAWKTGDAEKVGELLGYPACCRAKFVERCMAEKLIDPVWLMATDPGSIQHSELQAELTTSIFTNVLWRSIGIKAVPHLPCRFDCDPTAKLGELFAHAARQLGFEEEMEWLHQVLSWPVEWSALHGIAIIKTPVLKISTRTDATAQKLTVRRIGQDYPKEGAQGIVFPYRQSQRTGITQSPAYNRGIHHLDVQETNPVPR